MVDARTGRREARQLGPKVEVAGQDERILLEPGEGAVDLPRSLARIVVGRVQVRNHRAAHDAHGLADAVLSDPDRAEIVRLERKGDEDRIGLAGDGGAQKPMVEIGDHAPEGGAERRTPGRSREGVHIAPALQASERPEGKLLETEHVRPVGGRQPHHLLEVGPPSRRLGVAVEDVPAAHEEGHGPG